MSINKRSLVLKVLLSLSALLSLSLGTPVFAEEAKLSVKAEDVIRDNVVKYQGKAVTLMLSSGSEISGIVSEVGEQAVHLTQLTGKEMFDGLVPLENISAIIVRAK